MQLIPAAFVQRRWYDALSQLEYGTLRFGAPGGEEQIFGGRQPGPAAGFLDT
jgi:hypothetical protein